MYIYIYIYIIICCLTTPQPTMGHCQAGSLTKPMLITAFLRLMLAQATRILITRLCPKARPSTYSGLNQEPSESECNALTR